MRRTEQEMMGLLLSVAREDDRIRVVWMNGSRVNPGVPKDEYQDFDIVYAVTDMASFLDDPSWVDCFGERLIMQTPEAMSLYPPSLGGRFTYLMQFADGNRIDLMLMPLKDAAKYAAEDSLTEILLDKDSLLPSLPAPDARSYWVEKPSAAFYADCCNEFLWTACYVAKGICRGEFLYAQYHLEHCVRKELLRMLSWQVGMENNFAVSVGKCGKYLHRYLPEGTMMALYATYRNDSLAGIREGLFGCCTLFAQSARTVGAGLGYSFDEAEYSRVMAYLEELLPA